MNEQNFYKILLCSEQLMKYLIDASYYINIHSIVIFTTVL